MVHSLENLNVLQLFNDILETNKDNAQVLSIVIDALAAICRSVAYDLEESKRLLNQVYLSELVDVIEDLQAHKNDDVYRRAYSFIVDFMPLDNQL